MPTLDWIGKRHVINLDGQIPYRMIHCESGLSIGDAGKGNLIVEGDNLEALKALLPYYKEQVKCVFIDPPYNTGNEHWIYNDNVNAPEMKKWLRKEVGDEGTDSTRHDKWLCMMYPRLKLLHQLLREDGVIFVSIDDNEVANLRLVMDEIFGTQNFITGICWQKKVSPANDAKWFSGDHEYLLIYAKNSAIWFPNRLAMNSKQQSYYTNPDGDERGRWNSATYTCNKSKTERPNLYYAITNSITGEQIFPKDIAVWKYSRETHEQHVKNNMLYWGRNGTSKTPRLKKFISETSSVVPRSVWSYDDVGHTQEAMKEFLNMFPEGGFATPKPTRLIKRILQLATDKDSLILDSFAGSGTTGQAVLELNKEDGGNRRFILVELEPDIARPVTAQRLRRVIEGFAPARVEVETDTDAEGQTEPDAALFDEAELPASEEAPSPKRYEALGSGFRFCTLDAPLFDAAGCICPDVKFSDLAHHIFFTETGEPLPHRVEGDSPLIGCYNNVAYYLLWNGSDTETVLDMETCRDLPPHNGAKIVYADGCALPLERLGKINMRFKQIPYEVRVR